MDDVSAKSFEAHRDHLESVAYRMVGTLSEARDLVQDAYLRWMDADYTKVDDPRAYLTTIVTRLCIDHLRSARVRREQYIGPWLPEPVAGEEPDRSAELADSLSMAFLVVLEELNPVERAVFLLRDVFSYGYDEIASIIGKSPANCRKIASRARSRLSHRPSRFEARSEKQREMVERFMAAVDGEDLEGLLELLTDDVELYSDSGGKVKAARRPIYGSDAVSRFMVGIRRKAPEGLEVTVRDVNGAPGMVAYVDGEIQSAWSFELQNGRIVRIFVVVNPDKLAHVH